eukprot:COSAG05_NODE_135_length_16947_cov_294.166548_8_plen_278_part_00
MTCQPAVTPLACPGIDQGKRQAAVRQFIRAIIALHQLLALRELVEVVCGLRVRVDRLHRHVARHMAIVLRLPPVSVRLDWLRQLGDPVSGNPGQCNGEKLGHRYPWRSRYARHLHVVPGVVAVGHVLVKLRLSLLGVILRTRKFVTPRQCRGRTAHSTPNNQLHCAPVPWSLSARDSPSIGEYATSENSLYGSTGRQARRRRARTCVVFLEGGRPTHKDDSSKSCFQAPASKSAGRRTKRRGQLWGRGVVAPRGAFDARLGEHVGASLCHCGVTNLR